MPQRPEDRCRDCRHSHRLEVHEELYLQCRARPPAPYFTAGPFAPPTGTGALSRGETPPGTIVWPRSPANAIPCGGFESEPPGES